MRFACVLGVCLLPALAAAQPVQQFRADTASGPLPEPTDGALYRFNPAYRQVTVLHPLTRAGIGTVDTFSVVVESIGANPVPIVVERATYGSPGGVTWAAGGNALAAPLP